MRRDAVDRGGIDHRGQRARLETLLERAEELLAQVVLGDVGRRTVLAAERHAVAHIMLDAHRGVLQVDVVGVSALDGHRLRAGHLGLQIGILAPALPLAGPARVAAQVHHRREHPGHLGGAGLIGHRMAHHRRVLAVERGAEVDLLRIEGAVGQVGRAVDHIQAVDARDADFLHRDLLDLPDHRGRVLARMRAVVHHIEDGTDLVFAQDLVELGGVQRFVGVVLQHENGELHHLAGLLLQGHPLEDLLDLRLHRLVGGNGRSHGRAAAGHGGNQGQQEGKRLLQRIRYHMLIA